MTEKQVADLTASLKKFDLVEIPVVNIGGQLLAGHQRLKIMALLGRSEEVIDVRIPTKKLSEKDCEEYLLRSNKNTGGWDFDMLANEYEVEELSEWGFEDSELGLGIDVLNSDDSGGEDLYDSQFLIIVECKSESEQTEILDRFIKEGLQCKALQS